MKGFDWNKFTQTVTKKGGDAATATVRHMTTVKVALILTPLLVITILWLLIGNWIEEAGEDRMRKTIQRLDGEISLLEYKLEQCQDDFNDCERQVTKHE